MFFSSGATKVTVCGEPLTKSNKMAIGGHGQNLDPVQELVVLVSVLEHVNAIVQCKGICTFKPFYEFSRYASLVYCVSL